MPAASLPVLLERLVLALQSLALVGAILGSVYLLGRVAVAPAVDAVATAAGVEDTLGHTAVKLTRAGFGLLGLYLALPLSGLVTTPATIAAITAGATIAIGFASREVLSNLVSGAFLVVDPEFHVGDWIAWEGQEGIIEDIGFRVTRVHTFDNELITVPNSQLTTSSVTNPASKERRRLRVQFGVGYEEDLARAQALLREVAAENEDVLNRPAPRIQVAELGDSAVVLQVFIWVADPARAELQRIRADYVETVKGRLDEEGIEMPYPTRALTGSVGTWEAPPAPEE